MIAASPGKEPVRHEHELRDAVRRIRDGGWVMLCDGSPFWPTDARPADVRIGPIAYGLARLPRFMGQTKGEPYSVAQHSVHVSEELERAFVERHGDAVLAKGAWRMREAALLGLLHDGSEFVLGDLGRPVKRLSALAGYCDVERGVQCAIYRAFGLGLPGPVESELLPVVDRRMLRTEQRDLMPAALPEEGRDDVPPYGWHVEPWPWREAERRFLARFAELTQP